MCYVFHETEHRWLPWGLKEDISFCGRDYPEQQNVTGSVTGSTMSISYAECIKGVNVTLSGNNLPSDIAGFYVEAFDCERWEIGMQAPAALYQCFRKADGSSWRIWKQEWMSGPVYGCTWGIWNVRERYPGSHIMGDRYVTYNQESCSSMPFNTTEASGLSGAPLAGFESWYVYATVWS